MKSFALMIALGLPALAHAKPSAADAKVAADTVKVFSGLEQIDAETRERLLFQGCSEIAGCAGSCGQMLSAVAHMDPSQRGAALASEPCDAVDWKAQHDKNKKLTPGMWIDRHWTQFLDACAPLVPKADQAEFKANRKKAKL